MSPTEVDLARGLFSLLARAPRPRFEPFVPFDEVVVGLAAVVVVVVVGVGPVSGHESADPSLLMPSLLTTPLLLPVLAAIVGVLNPRVGDEEAPLSLLL